MSRRCAHKRRPFRPLHGFTLVELLVVIAIIALLVAILVPTLARAKVLAKEAYCLATVNGQLKAAHIYASSNSGLLACGTDQPLRYPGQVPQPPICSLATFQFWLGLNQQTSGLGVLLAGRYLSADSLFCPEDPGAGTEQELGKFVTKSSSDAWCSYLYRQLDGQLGAPAAGGLPPSPKARIDDLGLNGRGARVTAW